MTITLSKEFDFCSCKDVYMNGNRIGDVIKYDDGTFEIRVSKLQRSTTGGLNTVYTMINTDNESMIITLVSNFINQH
jgi:hypothetical protein